MDGMKQPPAGLPSANARKWHSRRWWDQLGYLRVRSLANAQWQRDSAWLVHVLVSQQASAPQEEQELYGVAIAAARRYPITASGSASEDQAWDEVLGAIDHLLEARQARHLEQVRAASGELE
jgi:hypothetical protein